MVKKEKTPLTVWEFVAMDNYPNGKKIQGQVNAYTLSEAVEEIMKQELFPIEVCLPKGKSPLRAQGLAIADAVANRLETAGIEAKAIASGRLIKFSKKQ
ncbi:MAG: hypothetical protein WCP18_01285 [bacterium]